MKQIFIISILLLFSSSLFAKNYTLITSKPARAVQDEASVAGFFIELVSTVFERSDLALRVKIEPWIRGQKKVSSASPKDGFVIVPLTRIQKREDLYDWIFPIITYELQFITNDRTLDTSNLEALKSEPVCVYRESPAEFKLKSLGFTKIRAKVKEQKCFMALKNKTEKIILAHGKVAAIKGYKLAGGNSDTLIYGKAFANETTYLASTKNAVSAKDLKTLKATFEIMKSDGSYDRIRDKYAENTKVD